MTRKKVVLVGSVVLMVAIGSIIVFSPKGKEKESSPAPLVQATDVVFPVKVAIVHRGDLVNWINSSGYAYPRIENEIKPNLDGQVIDMNAFDGEHVQQGEILFRLDDRELLIELQEAKDQLINAQVDYDLANKGAVDTTGDYQYRLEVDSLRRSYITAKRKFEEGSISRDELDMAKRNYDAFSVLTSVSREDVLADKIGLDQAQSRYRSAKLKLNYATIKAPFDGAIADCAIQPGSYVQAGETCMRIIDISRLRIKSEVTETDLPKINVGEEANVRFVAFPDRTFEGRVVQINPVVSLQKRTSTVIIEMGDQGSLIKPGMYATVTIAGNSADNVIIVPKGAVLFRDRRPLVFIASNGEALWSYVTLGHENDNYYEIKKGISPGDTLVVDGNYNLAHEAKVEITEMEKY